MEEAAARERKRRHESETPPSAAVAGEVQQYVYLPIADALRAPGAKVCLFAAVTEVGATVRSRGTDFALTLKIVDQSCDIAGISVTFFADNAALLPCVRSTGDVISLHNVVIAMHHEEFFVTYNKKLSSFALFEGKISTDCSPYQTSMKYQGSKHDNELLTQMRIWLVYHPPGLQDRELQLRNIETDSVFDLICNVLHVREVSNGEWILYAWDGTDAPPTQFHTLLDNEAKAPPLYPEEAPLPRDVLCALPCVGTVLRIFSNRFLKEVLHLQKGVHWARLCNITCKQVAGMWKGILLPSSKVRLLSNEDGSVVDRIKMHYDRTMNRVYCQPMSSLPKASNIADIEYRKAGYSTLMESLTHGQVTHKFKTLVRVVAAYPWGAKGIPSPATSKYCVRLTLEDPTARIHAYIHKEDGIIFFGGGLTSQVSKSNMNKLLGVPEDSVEKEGVPFARNPPWIWCCLKSYRLDKNNPWGSRRYRIFGTMIKG